jgi:hypothetical protein
MRCSGGDRTRFRLPRLLVFESCSGFISYWFSVMVERSLNPKVLVRVVNKPQKEARDDEVN